MVETSEYKDFSLRGRASTIAIQHLRYVVAAAEYEAAEAPRLEQSTLSRRVLQLEEAIGVTVFERSSGGVRATPAGRDFLRIARSILEQMDGLVTTARNTGLGEAGRLAVGFYALLSARNLRATFVDFRLRLPHVEHIVIATGADVIVDASASRSVRDCDERSGAPTTRRIGSSEYPSREHIICGG